MIWGILRAAFAGSQSPVGGPRGSRRESHMGIFLECRRAPKGPPGEDLRAHSILGRRNSLDLLIQWFRYPERSLGKQVHEETAAKKRKKARRMTSRQRVGPVVREGDEWSLFDTTKASKALNLVFIGAQILVSRLQNMKLYQVNVGPLKRSGNLFGGKWEPNTAS